VAYQKVRPSCHLDSYARWVHKLHQVFDWFHVLPRQSHHNPRLLLWKGYPWCPLSSVPYYDSTNVQYVLYVWYVTSYWFWSKLIPLLFYNPTVIGTPVLIPWLFLWPIKIWLHHPTVDQLLGLSSPYPSGYHMVDSYVYPKEDQPSQHRICPTLWNRTPVNRNWSITQELQVSRSAMP